MTLPVIPLENDRPADTRDDDVAALADFIGKWRARWPEWVIAETFVPTHQRETALAWATLQQEFTDAAWGGSDPRPGLAKLGWWQEELNGWTRGARRHPIAIVLQAVPAPWQALAAALPSLADTRERPASVADAFASLEPFALAISNIDSAMFGADAGVDVHQVVAANLLHSRMVHDGDDHVPLDMLARAGRGDARAAWTSELARQWPEVRASTRVRRLWAALANQRLRSNAPFEPIPTWKALWIAWRSAQH